MAGGPVIGLDLGGTKMLACVYDSDFKLLGRAKAKTMAAEGEDAIYNRVIGTIACAMEAAGLKRKDIAGVGIGSPGPLDPDKGIILDPPNLPLRNFPLAARASEELGMPVILENDVNAGTYGEFRFGAGKGSQHVIGLFPGTGIGGGVVINGRLLHGASGLAGEFGHMRIQLAAGPCGGAMAGTVESLASRLALAKEAAMLAARGQAPTILELAGTDLAQIRSKVLAKAFAKDPEVRQLVLRSAEMLAVAMANLVCVLDPEIIIVGGGLVEELPDDYINHATSCMRNYLLSSMGKKTKVKKAKLGDYAVAMGAAALIRDRLQES